MAGSQGQRPREVGASPELPCGNATLQTHLCVLRRCPETAPAPQKFEVSVEGRQGAALQAREPLCAWFKLTHTWTALGCSVRIKKKQTGKHQGWDFPGKGSRFQPSKAFLAPSLLVRGLARGVWGGIHLKTQVQYLRLI